jgi:hypothetical protein
VDEAIARAVANPQRSDVDRRRDLQKLPSHRLQLFDIIGVFRQYKQLKEIADFSLNGARWAFLNLT